MPKRICGMAILDNEEQLKEIEDGLQQIKASNAIEGNTLDLEET